MEYDTAPSTRVRAMIEILKGPILIKIDFQRIVNVKKLYLIFKEAKGEP